MNIPRLLTRQWHGYAIHHRHRTNLLLHIVAVPLFMAASALIGLAAWRPSLGLLEACIAGLVVSVFQTPLLVEMQANSCSGLTSRSSSALSRTTMPFLFTLVAAA